MSTVLSPHQYATTHPAPAAAFPPAAAMAAPWPPPMTGPGPHRPARTGWHRRLLPSMLGVLATGLLLYGIVYAALVTTGDPLFIPVLILVGASAVPATFALYVSRLAGPTRLSARMLAMTAVWGGVLGAVIAGILESGAATLLGGLPTPFIGVFEESAKLLVPAGVMLFAVRLRHREADGLLIGVAVGVVFAVLETMGYAFVALLQAHGSLHAMDQLLLVRGLLAPAGHAAWTGLAAAALWRFGLRPSVRTAVGFLGTFTLVVVLHTIWDSTSGWPWYLGLATVSLGLLHLRLWRIRRTDAAGPVPTPHRTAAPAAPWLTPAYPTYPTHPGQPAPATSAARYVPGQRNQGTPAGMPQRPETPTRP